MWTPLPVSVPPSDAQFAFTSPYILRISSPCDLLISSSNIEADDTDLFPSCGVGDAEEEATSSPDFYDDDLEYDRRSLSIYENQFYVPGYPASELVAASTASLPVFAPVDPTARSNPLVDSDNPPYAIYIIPIVLFSVILITVVVLSIRYRRLKRPQRLYIEPPRMDPEKMGTLRSTPLGIYMPEDDPFTNYSNDSSVPVEPVEPSRPVPVFMPAEVGSSHSRRSTIRQSRSYTHTMPAARRSKRRPKVPKAQSTSTIGASSSRRSSTERVRPPIPAARSSNRSLSKRPSEDVNSHEEVKNVGKDDSPGVYLGSSAMEFGEDIPLNTPQQPGSSKEDGKPPQAGPSKHEFWHKV